MYSEAEVGLERRSDGLFEKSASFSGAMSKLVTTGFNNCFWMLGSVKSTSVWDHGAGS